MPRWTNAKAGDSKLEKLVPLLLDWFSQKARDLPWRHTRDPYAIWVSEIMLQQTQVKTVIPYWERWMRELPTLHAAAKASPARLHKLWEGLGYYTRVRNLQKAAQHLVSEQEGKFPQTFDAALALPGIGRYTAGAICSIAFNQPTPILDGNVIRVLTRLHGIRTDPRAKATNAQLWQLAQNLVTHASRMTSAARKQRSRTRRKDADDRNCSYLNQSLMELGALICTPHSPNCPACPVRKHCLAWKENLQTQLPNLGKRVAASERRFLAFVVERDGRFLVRQRPPGVVNAHLWEFPNIEVGPRVGGPQRTAMHSKQLADGNSSHPKLLRLTDPVSLASQRLGFRLASAKPFCTLKHSITRYRITVEAWRATIVEKPLASRPVLPGRWRRWAQLEKLAFTSAHRKILRAVCA